MDEGEFGGKSDGRRERVEGSYRFLEYENVTDGSLSLHLKDVHCSWLSIPSSDKIRSDRQVSRAKFNDCGGLIYSSSHLEAGQETLFAMYLPQYWSHPYIATLGYHLITTRGSTNRLRPLVGYLQTP